MEERAAAAERISEIENARGRSASDDGHSKRAHQRRRLRRCGADAGVQILGTIITDHVDRMVNRIRALVKHRERDPLIKEVVAGIHIEGPFINATNGYRGAHPADAVIPADVEAAKRMHEACGGLLRL